MMTLLAPAFFNVPSSRAAACWPLPAEHNALRLQVRAFGALLTHLQSTVFALEESGLVDVAAVRQLDVSGSMRIDGMTLR